MEVYDKIRKIRKRLDMPQKHLAMDLGCSLSLISKFEDGSRRISEENLLKLRRTLGIPDVPLTQEEVRDFMSELLEWRDLINDGDLEEASILQENLARRAEMSLETDVQLMYMLISVSFFRASGDEGKVAETVALLASMREGFDRRQLYRYLIVKGADSINTLEYKKALGDLLSAEELDKELNLANEWLFYNIAACFMFLGYVRKGEEYVEKARKRAELTSSVLFEICYRAVLAVGYNQIGRHLEALDILNYCLRLEKSRMHPTRIRGSLLHSIGISYFNMKNHEKAEETLNESLSCLEEHDKLYALGLYQKVRVLQERGKAEEMELCLQEGLSRYPSKDVFGILFKVIECMNNLDDEGSTDYIENVAIPSFLEAGWHRVAIEYCDKLKEYFAKKKRFKLAYKYAEMSRYHYKKIAEADIV